MRARLLVVDDRLDVRNLLQTLLSDEYEVESAASAPEAIGIIRQKRPPEDFDAIVTDMRMEQDDSGIAVVKAAAETAPTTPVIVMTAYAGLEDAVASMKAGAFSYLTRRGEEGESELLLLHVQRALHYRASLSANQFCAAAEANSRRMSEALGILQPIAAQIKGMADLWRRVSLSRLDEAER